MTGRRLLLAGLIAVALVQCGAWFVVATFLWSFREFLATSYPDVIAQRTQWAFVLFAWAVINSIALVAFLVRSRGWGWRVLTGVQVVDLFSSLIATVAAEAHWWLFSLASAVMLILLYLYMRSTVPMPVEAKRLGGDASARAP